jgi:hypothetical protein
MSKNETNANTLFNELRAEAKVMGISTKNMKRPEIEQAIRDAQASFAEQTDVVTEEEIPEVNVDTITTVPVTEVVNVEGVVVAEVKRLGRPIDPNSPRQIRLAEAAALRVDGKLKRGRPVLEGCARQTRVQVRLEKIANGIEIKPGRPKMEKPIIAFVTVEDAVNVPVGIAIENELPPQE